MGTSIAQCVLDMDGNVIAAEEADLELPTASVGKVFLLCEAAQQISDGVLDPSTPLNRDEVPAVADSGLWQHFTRESLPLIDTCVLIASVSDNWATNVLLHHIGLATVAERARRLGCARSRLHDQVRDDRGPADPPALSTGTARELAEVARRIHCATTGVDGLGLTPAAARLVEAWLRTGVDLTLVAAPLRLDPLAHTDTNPGLWNKTGWDAGVRAEMGLASTPGASLAYAAIGRWQVADEAEEHVLSFLHGTGSLIANRLRLTKGGITNETAHAQ